MLGKFAGPFMIALADEVQISPILMAGFVMMALQVAPLIPIKETLMRTEQGIEEKGEYLLEGKV